MTGISLSQLLAQIKAEAEQQYELGMVYGDDRRLEACGRLEKLEDELRALPILEGCPPAWKR